MSMTLWLAFVAAAGILLVMPGPTVLTDISYTMAHGRRAKPPPVAAVVLGARRCCAAARAWERCVASGHRV